MRRIVFFAALLCVLCIHMNLAASNMQKMYPIDSELYEGISHLYIQKGLALPSSSGPWSGDELHRMLHRLDFQALSQSQKALYHYIHEKLDETSRDTSKTGTAFSFGFELSGEGYFQTNTDDFFANEQTWQYGYKDRSPVINIPLETWATDHFYGYIELSIMNSRFGDYFTLPFTTNLLFDRDVVSNLAFHFPDRGFAVAGGKNWNVQFGRDAVSWGDGITGNLLVGGHLDYHEFIRFTTYGKSYKFTSLFSSFVHPAWHYDNANEYYLASGTGGQNTAKRGFKAFIAHRAEFRPWERFKISVTEAFMYMGDSFDFRFLNPGMIYHNFYMRSNSNSILGIEMDYTPIPSINLYVNMAIDEFALPGEPTSGSGTNPQAFGFLGGIKTSRQIGQGTAFLNAEAVYTDPYLYLRDSGGKAKEDDSSINEFPINFIVSLWQWRGDKGLFEARRFLGYKYGNDVAAFSINGGYKVYGAWSLQAGVLYLLEGTHDMFTKWKTGSDDDPDPSSAKAPTSGNFSDPSDPRDSVQQTLLLELKGTYSLIKNLELFAHTSYRHVWNIDNLKSNGNDFDLQVSFGATYSL